MIVSRIEGGFKPIQVVLETEDEVKRTLAALIDYNNRHYYSRSPMLCELINKISKLEPTLG